jgi:hypothetical protein
MLPKPCSEKKKICQEIGDHSLWLIFCTGLYLAGKQIIFNQFIKRNQRK